MSRSLLGRVACVVALFSGVVPVMQGVVQSRIVGGVGTKMVALPQSVSPKLDKATDLGDAEAGRTLSSITLRFSMTEVQKAELTQLLIDQQNPASAKYRQWLSPEQFAAQFGLNSADMATVSQWVTSRGFRITAVARSRSFIQFSGTVAQAQSAFQTRIHKVTVDGEEHIANVTAAVMPAGIASVVGAVSGLDDFKLKARARVLRVQASADPKFTSSISGSNFIAPGDFYTIYDVKPLLASSINGAGITIAVAGQTDISLSDMAAFRSAAGLSTNLPTVKLFGADPGTPKTNGAADDEAEADLDLEWSGAVAPSATIVYANSTNVIDSLLAIIDNKLGSIASISYGDCESDTGATNIESLNQSFMQANAEGITVVGPAGDAGATDCDYGRTTSATHGLAVDFPASSPNVTALGGTMFHEAGGSYFSGTNDANGGSAISYIPEEVWNESAQDILANPPQLGAAGGGKSAFLGKPSWQRGTGVPDDSARDVPDVSLNAASNHDGYLICTQGSCTNGFRNANNGLAVVGGTSVSTPAFAAILALVQQKTGAATANANPTIYALANSSYYGTVFHDTTAGNNSSPCTTGSTGCPTGGSIGYSAGVGYDLASGWGSVDAFNLANSWSLTTPGVPSSVADFTLTPTTATITTKSGSDATPLVFTVTSVNGFAGSVAFSVGTTNSVLNASGSFSVTPVAVTSKVAGTTALTLSAYVSNGQAVGGKGQLRLESGGTASGAPSAGMRPERYAGSVAALACVVLLMLPRRRKFGALLGVAVAALTLSGMLGMSGCGSGSSSVAPITTSNATPGTYTINVIAVGTDAAGTQVSHSSTVTFVVQ